MFRLIRSSSVVEAQIEELLMVFFSLTDDWLDAREGLDPAVSFIRSVDRCAVRTEGFLALTDSAALFAEDLEATDSADFDIILISVFKDLCSAFGVAIAELEHIDSLFGKIFSDPDSITFSVVLDVVKL